MAIKRTFPTSLKVIPAAGGLTIDNCYSHIESIRYNKNGRNSIVIANYISKEIRDKGRENKFSTEIYDFTAEEMMNNKPYKLIKDKLITKGETLTDDPEDISLTQ